MLNPEQAIKLRELIARHAHYQFQAGRLERRHDHEQRARVQAAADASTRALCAALAALTKEEMENENC
jgi:hypothetical protein